MKNDVDKDILFSEFMSMNELNIMGVKKLGHRILIMETIKKEKEKLLNSHVVQQLSLSSKPLSDKIFIAGHASYVGNTGHNSHSKGVQF